ncbi:DUF917 domain-containing protein [Acidaminobacter hydrogenoformans]|uniref:DUF917 domain-containing protein n=1 Tax=Acidaminobacter hydrogenoformans DSM 2784 TaxID=1120920 RepID=A0A1G5RVL7_9FIRM|nr:DUF917 domain-containing protein [Acidaminobacter hydrogenoformans]SCZ77957.1 hypothetical protein SAMN03080599_01029 [Acidaminobacter hydrogenoformans DSM 2784]
MKLTTKQEVEDFVRGCTFYATGGGGLPENGVNSLMSEIEKGKEVGWIEVDHLSDDVLTACPFLMGSIAPHSSEVINEMEGFGFVEGVNSEKERLAKAVIELEHYTGLKIDAIVPIELAGANTSGPVSAAVSLGKLAVDGDFCGRAIPEILQITPYLHGKDYLPITSVDEWGNVCIIKESTSLRVAERVGKMISASAYGLAGQAGFVMTGKELKETIIPGTLTEAYELGKHIRISREQNLDVINQITCKTKGWLLAKGKIQSFEDEDRIGYYWGNTIISGVNEFDGDTFKIWFKNENHVMWKNEKPFVTSPDLICIVDLETGEPIPNPKIIVGQNVAVIGISSKPQLRSKKAIDVLGPRYFGFDMDYIPIEDIVDTQKK